jgi:tRNA-dihydrouridine synthase
MTTFWDNLPKPFFCLAPMEDVTDVVFRSVVAKAGRPDVFFTEFMNVSGFCHPDGRASVARRLVFKPEEQPIIAQIWGSDPEKFAETATELAKMGFAGVDINMGCPDKSVVKSGGGSALIERTELAVEIIQAVNKSFDDVRSPVSLVKPSENFLSSTKTFSRAAPPRATPPARFSGLPISVKTRLGAYQAEEWKPWLTTLLKQDLAALTVHLRTRKEMSKVPAHYELIPEIVALRDAVAPQTRLIINGDVRDRSHGIEMSREYPGVDGWMIGRGVFTNPFCFETSPHQHSREELIELLKYHLDLFDQLGHERKFEPLKRFFKIYINNFPGSKSLREKLMDTKNTAEARTVLAENITQ